MLKDIFGSLGFVIVGSDILFWAYFFIMDNTCIPFVLINDRKMIDAKHVHKLLECKFDCCNIKNDDRVLDIIHRSIIAYVDKDIESELHARFDIKGIYREWFNLSDCDLININSSCVTWLEFYYNKK